MKPSNQKAGAAVYNVLICDDQPDIVNALKIYLAPEGYQLFTAENGEQALELVRTQAIHLVLLDIMMPRMDGITATAKIREISNAPIILLTAKSETEDMVLGLNVGADDYITKPFTMSVLYAKTAALIKRSRGSMLSRENRIEVAGITLDTTAHKVYLGRKEIILTPKEYSLLLCLMRNKNIVMSREQLLVKCWGYDYEGESRAVDTHIKRLREKLGDHAGCIKTVIKAGYVLEG